MKPQSKDVVGTNCVVRASDVLLDNTIVLEVALYSSNRTKGDIPVGQGSIPQRDNEPQRKGGKTEASGDEDEHSLQSRSHDAGGWG